VSRQLGATPSRDQSAICPHRRPEPEIFRPDPTDQLGRRTTPCQ
jgi:hypothetical protein